MLTVLRRLARQARQRRGLTLVELLIVLAIIGTLAAIAAPLYAEITERAKVARAIADIRIMDSEIIAFQSVNGRLPTTLTEIGHGSLKDPWGNPYVFLNFVAAGPGSNGQRRKDRFLVPLNSTYDLYSKGKDGQSQPPLTASASHDDIIRANDGGYIGMASQY